MQTSKLAVVASVLLLECCLAGRQLPALSIDPSSITISGISSGADFVVNLHVAHSQTIRGVGVFAGQAYHCAVTRFPKDELVKKSEDTSVPVCDGCPINTTLTYDHCKNHPEWVDVDLLVAFARNQSALGTIDNVSNIADGPLYFYRGTHDTCYKTGAEEATLSFYSRLTLDRGQEGRVAYEGSIPSNHAQPTQHYGAPCGGKSDPKYSYIESCGYDAAGALLRHMYGKHLAAPAKTFNPENLVQFDQSEFWVNASNPGAKSPNLPRDGSAGLSDKAYAYIPSGCIKGNATEPCRMHLYHHGCCGPWGSVFYEGVTHHAGFNEYAETNNIVIIYPAMSSWGETAQSRSGCWDGYGQTGTDYSVKSGAQITVVHNMIMKLSTDGNRSQVIFYLLILL